MSDLTYFPPDQLMSLASDIFAAAGCSRDEAQQVATRLVHSNLVGHDSHGVIRIPFYCQWLQEEKVFAGKTIQIVVENETIAVVDGQFGLGQSVGEQATQLGIDKSAKQGVAVIALRNAGHLGRIGDWAEMAADAGKISLHLVNTSGAGMLVAPFGGIDRRVSANPLAVGIPTDSGQAMILDISTCQIAEGKIRVALHRDQKVPAGCLIDAQGTPTDDPNTFYDDPPGAILPIAGHKGHGLGIVTDILAGALTGSSCTNPQNAWRLVNGMLSIIIDHRFFANDDAFFPEIRRFIEFVKSSRTVSPDGEILMPGEIEMRTHAQRIKTGIGLDKTTWSQISDTCRMLNVTHSLG